MPNTVRREYWQSLRDKSHDLFLHYSLVRMAILAFLLPLGALIIIQDNGRPDVGGFIIVVAVILNWMFGTYALSSHLNYEILRNWLKEQNDEYLDEKGPGEVDELFGSYRRVCFFKLPIKPIDAKKKRKLYKKLIEEKRKIGEGINENEISEEINRKEELYKKINKEKFCKGWKKREPLIQWPMLVSIIVFAILLLN